MLRKASKKIYAVPCGKNHVTNSHLFRKMCGWKCSIYSVLPLRNFKEKKIVLCLALSQIHGLVGCPYHKGLLDSL